MITERAREAEHLAMADRHIAEGERRVSDQAVLVRRLCAKGYDTAVADTLLCTLETTLAEWRAHRALIVQRVEQIDANSSRLRTPTDEPSRSGCC